MLFHYILLLSLLLRLFVSIASIWCISSQLCIGYCHTGGLKCQSGNSYSTKSANTANHDSCYPALTAYHFAAQLPMVHTAGWTVYTRNLRESHWICSANKAGTSQLQASASDTRRTPWDGTASSQSSPVQVAAQMSYNTAETIQDPKDTQGPLISLHHHEVSKSHIQCHLGKKQREETEHFIQQK